MMTGNFANPKITTDLQKAMLNLAGQVANQQKTKAINKGVDALGKLLNKNPKDTTKAAADQQNIKDKAGQLLNGLFKKK